MFEAIIYIAKTALGIAIGWLLGTTIEWLIGHPLEQQNAALKAKIAELEKTNAPE